MRTRLLPAFVAALALVVSVSVAASGTASAAPTGMPAFATAPVAAVAATSEPALRMPSDVPSKKTPWILDGEVTKIVQIGNTMVVAGLFTTVSDPMNGPQYSRANIFAFDETTGLVSQTFKPTFDGQVQQLLPGPTPDTVYVAGDFTKVNGVGPNHLQLLNVNTGLAVSSFKAPSTNGGIETMEILPNNRLFIGGFFTRINGVTHGELVTLNATTGALDPYMDIQVAGHHNNTGTGAQAPIGPRESDLTPGGDRLIVVGNFKTVAGLARDQIVMVNLDTTSATVSTTWATTLYSPICSPGAFDSYMRDVEMSPDGTYFSIAVTGGPHTGTLCDSATRWETYATGTTLSPTWVANTGGDTLWGVGITDAAVYVGGHPRWMNNPNGSDRAGQGAVPRPGLVALDPTTGVPLKWNPGRNPRGEAAYDIYPTDDGLYVVSDTDWIGDRRYQRPRLAFFPNSEGYNVASTKSGSLPGNVYIATPSTSNVLYRVNAGGAAVTATDGGPNWAVDTTAAPSTNHNTGSVATTQSAITAANLVNVPATTPLGIWTSERNDPTGGNEMQWDFAVATGTSTTVRLYFAARSNSTRKFNVIIDGVTKLTSYDPTSDPGTNKGTMKSFDVTSDGNVDIDFAHINGGTNPELNAVEILSNTSGTTDANVVSYDGTAIASQTPVTTADFDWTTVRGAFMVGRSLFYGSTDSMLYKRSFDGVNFGPAQAVNPYHDPLWNTVQTGSGQTYDGMTPTWYGQLGSLTGMFYSNGRLYYTLSGTNSLFWRYFVPDSGIVSPTQNTVAGGNISWTNTRGMFLDGTNLYTVSGIDGSLSRIPFINGAPSGTAAVVNSKATGGIDWRGRALFLASVLPNVGPTASFTQSCAGITCTFDSSASSDSDGMIASYAWEFGDGATSGAAAPDHDYLATGTYEVTLTVTDDSGVTGSTTHEVSVVKPNDPPTAAFALDCTYLECTVDGSASTDGDGTVDGYAWDFGDPSSADNTATDATSEHTFSSPGDYTVELTVTDDDAATDTMAKSVTVTAAPVPSTVQYVGSSILAGNASTPHTTVPAVSAGDRLVMVLSLAASDRVLADPTGVTGWTVLGTSSTTGMATTTYTKLAEATDAGKQVTVSTNLATKYTMTVAAYSGARSGSVVSARFAETVSRADHTTPVVNAPAGAWVLSDWADKSSLTTGFTLPNGVTSRQRACAPTTGRICSVLADSAGSVPAGSYGGLTATADSASNNATTWTIVLRTVDANVAPTAAFTKACDSLTCSFDASTSSDPDGNVASYAWDFGDGGTASGVSPSHTFSASNDYTVTLTVTDDQGSESSPTTATFHVQRTNAPPTAAYTSTCRYLVCSFDASGSGDSDGTVDSYSWDFGDGSTGTGVSPAAHAFPAGDNYQVTLTVTDSDGTPTTVTKAVSVVAIKPITLVGSTSNAGNVVTPNGIVPVETQAGDRLVMILSLNAGNRVQSAPTGTTGWTQVDTATSGSATAAGMVTTVYTKVAAAGEGGRVVRVPLDLAAKYTMTVAAYSGDMLAPTVRKAAETVNRASHTTPIIDDAVAGDIGLSYWADKSSATTAFTLPNGVTQRQAACAASTGRVCSVLAESTDPISVAGPYGGLAATADSSQASATMWTILLRLDV